MKVKILNNIIEDNISLARFCANKFKGRGIEYDDIFQVACVGLVKSANAYDESKGFKFSTYAVNVILGEIKQLFRSNSTINISRNVKNLSIKINKIREIFLKLECREPTLSEIAKELSVTTEQILEAIDVIKPVVSFDLSEFEKFSYNLSEYYNENLIQDLALSEALKKLSNVDKIIVNSRFFKHEIQSFVAKKLGVSQVQVSRKEKYILNFLKNELSNKKNI